ncbi:restriction endonuclease [Luteimonas sp. MJ246]|uniref:restriction endonuclease n=1 Tax=Luteimonas sp. MJ174 TaxID=3129237 RepID=UPI0031BAC116
MLKWLFAIVVVLAIGVAATWLAHGPLRRRDETAAGIAALSAMSWREFIRIVLEALSRRGYHRVVDREAPSGDSDHTLVRNGDHWLLSTKHGSAFVLGRAAVNELTAAMGLAGAVGGLLVTQGRIDDDARRTARGQAVELLDGATLWPELRPLVPAAALAPIEKASAKRARERSLAGWLMALITGVAIFALLPAPQPPAAAAASPADTPADSTALEQAAMAMVEPDAAALQAQRRELAATVATLPGMSRALWTSSSTLEVFVAGAESDPFPAICSLVERYPALASSRIQVTSPVESGRAVRFRQCRSY